VKIFDPLWAQRLAKILQTRGTSPEAPTDLPFAGIVITIPGEAVLENLAGITAARAIGISKTELTDPANGTEFRVTVPAGEAWRLLSIHAQLVTSATVATRSVYLFVDGGSTVRPIYRDALPSGTGQAASTTWQYTWALGTPIMEESGNFKKVRPLPDLILLPGWAFQSNTINLQAGDSWEIVTYVIEKASYR